MKSTKKRKFRWSPIIWLLVAIACLALEVVLELLWKNGGNLQKFFCILLSNIASILGVSSVWDWVEKNKFSRDLMKEYKMADSVIDSGIYEYCQNYTEVQWGEEIRNVTSLTACLTFGENWLEDNSSYLYDFTMKKGELKIILPDYTCNDVIRSIEIKYPKKKGRVKDTIKESIEKAKECGAQIYLYSGVLNASYFQLDGRYFISLYAHNNSARTKVPIIKLKDGYFSEFCKCDLDRIIEKSKLIEG